MVLQWRGSPRKRVPPPVAASAFGLVGLTPGPFVCVSRPGLHSALRFPLRCERFKISHAQRIGAMGLHPEMAIPRVPALDQGVSLPEDMC